MAKILYVSHGDINSPFGASTSLRNHIKLVHNNCNDHEYIVYQRLSIRNLSSWISLILSLLNTILPPRHYTQYPFDESAIFTGYLRLEYNFEGADNESPRFNWLKDSLSRLFELQLLLLIIKTQPDIIHFNSISIMSTALRLRRLFFLKKIRIILHLREHPSLHTRMLLRKSAHLIDHYIAIEPTVARRFLEIYPSVPSSKVTTLQNIFLQPSKKAPPTLSPSSNITFAFVGQISYEKNVHLLLDAFDKFKLSFPSALLLLVGDLAQEFDHPSLPVQPYSLTQQIYWHPSVPNLAETSFFSDIQCIIRPDPHYMTGRTTYEALYAGTTLIMTGHTENLNQDEQLNPFKDKIIFINNITVDEISAALTYYYRHRHLSGQSSAQSDKPYSINNNSYIKVYNSLIDTLH